MHRSSSLLIFVWAVSSAAQDAPKPQLTARELFYSAASEPAAKPAQKAPPAPQKAVTTQKAPPATPQKVAAKPPDPPSAQHTEPVALPDGGKLIKAVNKAPSTAPAPPSGTPLGLKYTILKKSGDNMVEVPPDTVFHNGDKIQLSVQTNGPGFLYIINQGSSGTWQPMFPSPEVEDGNNHVDGWSAKIMPPGSLMTLVGQTGTERIFIVFSRNPEDGLENMVYSLKGMKARPASGGKEVKAQPKQMVEIAQANIDDATVGQLRETYTRDLIIEKVDDKTPTDKSPGDKKESAVYVVNPSGSSDSRVVADLKLVHQ